MIEYECALTGLTAPGVEPTDVDGLDDLPVGWMRIRITRRKYNPKWVLIQQVKEAMIDGIVSQFPPEVQDMQRYAVLIQVEAQFHGLEKDTPMYVPDVDDVVYLSDSGEILESINDIRNSLGLDSISTESIEEDEDETA